MSLAIWISMFGVYSIFALWVLFSGGADWLERSFVVLLLVSRRSANWSADGIKIFVGLSWLVVAFWFVVGIFDLDVRRFLSP
jgi:hypothetical protein